MTRNEVKEEILSIDSRYILCELPTSFGKTKIALELADKIAKPLNKKTLRILIVVPRVVLKGTWRKEIEKWGYEDYLSNIEYVTYASFPKKAGTWDIVIFDEVHHLSERCRDALSAYNIKHGILLSATVGRDMRKELSYAFEGLHTYKVSTKKAIEEEILPDPEVYLFPMNLDRFNHSFEIVKNKSQKQEITISYENRFSYTKISNKRIVIKCTQRQYYDDMSSLIAWYKRKKGNAVFKNMFLHKSGERLKWLSNQKTWFVKYMLDTALKGERTLTFCNSIEQTQALGEYCINSANKNSSQYLQDFNGQKVDHITACDMLNEGANLVNCRVGVYAVLNSSERLIKQKLGRLLRHPNPIIIIPYFRNTREQEIVETMLEDYNPDLVHTINQLNEIKL